LPLEAIAVARTAAQYLVNGVRPAIDADVATQIINNIWVLLIIYNNTL
jgi:hypothetical protein